MVQHEAVAGRSAASRRAALPPVPDRPPARAAAIDPDRHGVTARQLQRHDRARVADHRVAHQLAQPLGIGRLARLAGGHVGGAKFLERLEDAGLQQRQQVVELDQIVLHRRRGEQQQETLVERVDQLVALADAVAQVMGLVDDDEIEAAASRRSACSLRRAERNRRDQALLAQNRSGSRAQQRVVGGRAGNVELGLQLLAPLPDQRGRRQHQHAARPCRAADIP